MTLKTQLVVMWVLLLAVSFLFPACAPLREWAGEQRWEDGRTL